MMPVIINQANNHDLIAILLFDRIGPARLFEYNVTYCVEDSINPAKQFADYFKMIELKRLVAAKSCSAEFISSTPLMFYQVIKDDPKSILAILPAAQWLEAPAFFNVATTKVMLGLQNEIQI